MKRLVFLAIAIVVAVGCKSERELKLMGLWSGEFVLDQPTTSGIKTFKGYMRLFGNEKYVLHLDNSSQNFDVAGKWKIDKHRLDLTVTGITFQNPSEIDQSTLNLKVVPVSEIQASFGRAFFLKMDDAQATLTGLTTHLGPLVGHQLLTRRQLDQGQ